MTNTEQEWSEPRAWPRVELRFVEREVDTIVEGLIKTRVLRILQQRWQVERDCACGCGAKKSWLEWRDVPVEDGP